MRGSPQAQPDFLTVINLHQGVPADHPLRVIKRRVDAARQDFSCWGVASGAGRAR